MMRAGEDTRLRLSALAYVTALHNELTGENGAPPLGTQNQAADFILADPALCDAVAAWAATSGIDEAAMAPPRRLPQDALYACVRTWLEEAVHPRLFPATAERG